MPTDWIIPLLTLSAMEIVLGIDNVIFIAIVAGRLPPEQQPKARRLGLVLALVTRVLLLIALKFLLGMDQAEVFRLSSLGIPESWIGDNEKLNVFTVHDLILIVGGLFLIGKSVFEIHDKLEGPQEQAVVASGGKFGMVLVQIALLDIVFSLDSVVTAVGMSKDIAVMIAAMSIAMLVMLVFAGKVSEFVHRHPTIKMLALSFLILIGVMLVAEGLEKHIERGYIYFAMSFALVVEFMNMRLRKVVAPVKLHEPAPPKGM